jgi:hypothetical protein
MYRGTEPRVPLGAVRHTAYCTLPTGHEQLTVVLAALILIMVVTGMMPRMVTFVSPDCGQDTGRNEPGRGGGYTVTVDASLRGDSEAGA